MLRLLSLVSALKRDEEMLKSSLLGRDYSEIDAQLVGKHAVARGRVAAVSDATPPQGSPFLHAVKSMSQLLKLSDLLYRR